MPAQFAALRWTFTAGATSAQAKYPVANLNIVDNHPLLYSWRSNNQTTLQTINCDIGALHTIGAVALLNLNVSSVQLGWSVTGASYTDFLTLNPNGEFPVTRNPFGYYRNLIAIEPIAARYIQIRIPSQTTTNGASSFELGMVWIAPFLSSFPSGPEVGLRQTPKRDYLRSGHGVATAGPWFSDEEWQATMNKADTNSWSSFILGGSETPHLIYKNLGDPSEVGIFRFRDAVSFVRNELTVVVNPALEEMA